MKLYLNQKELNVDSEPITVDGLLNANQLPSKGIAVAVNNKVVRKTNWASTILNEGDSVTVITAVCGG